MTKVSLILILIHCLWTTCSCYVEHDYANDDARFEMLNDQPEYSADGKKQDQVWPPKPYFVVNRYIKQTLLPSVRKLEPGQSIEEALKEIEAASQKPGGRYSPPPSPKYDSNEWTPLQFTRGVNRYSIAPKLPDAEQYTSPMIKQAYSSSQPEELVPLQETYRTHFRPSPQVFLEKMEHESTPRKIIQKVIYRRLPDEPEHIPIGEPVRAHSIPPYRRHKRPVESEEEEEDEEEDERPVRMKLPFPKPPKFRKMSPDSIGALYSRLTCQHYRDPKGIEESEYELENGPKDDSYIYMFKNKFQQ